MRIILVITLIALVLIPTSRILGQAKLDYSLFFIGSIAEKSSFDNDRFYQMINEKIKKETDNSAIIFLGDNARPIATKNLVDDELTIDEVKKIVDGFEGKIYAIPGNLEWRNGDQEGYFNLENEETLLESLKKKKDVLIPDDGCPGPEKKKLDKNISLLALDSQWWLQSHSDEHRQQSECKNQDVEEIIQELVEHFDDDDDKQIVVALHHPIYSAGRYGGHYDLKDHLFPLTNVNNKLWIPLPIIGSVFPFYRRAIGTEQDLTHPLYENLRERMLGAGHFRKDIIYLSGHEHNFQYFNEENKHYINLGSGSKVSTYSNKTDAQFSLKSRSLGKLEFYKNGEVKLIVFSFEDDILRKVFEKGIVSRTKKFGSPVSLNLGADSTIIMEASKIYNKARFHRFLFGKLNRKIWSAKVEHKKLDLSKARGGLRPYKIGGGKTTKSIRLKDSLNRQYVLRTVDKKTYKLIPKIYKNSLVEGVIQDQVIGASNPYSALAVPPLAEAAGVYHTNPEFYFLPKQEYLGDYNGEFGDQLFLFEERPSGKFKSAAFFGESRKIVSFSKVLEQIEASPGHHIHQEQVLKSRLFDFLIGDWDRHDDQWRWASFTEPSHLGGDEWLTYFEPIPRDRDQVFFEYDGLLSSIIKMVIPRLRIWHGYGDDITNMKYFNFSAKHFDRSYLTELERNDWHEIAEDLSLCITNEVIDQAIDRLPVEIQNISGSELRDNLKIRRNKISKWADKYYNYISKYVDVVGSKYPDLFQANRINNDSLSIKVFQFQKDGKLRDLIYERVFLESETNEVRLFGLAGDDLFQIRGEVNRGPLIRVIGGKGDDRLDDKSFLKGKKKSVIVYDNITDNEMTPGLDGKDRRSTNYSDNVYDRNEFYYNSSIGLPYIGFSQDEGFTVRYDHLLSTYAYRKLPYGARHSMGTSYSVNKKQLQLYYKGIYTDAFGKADFGLSTYFHLPNRVSNFFGLTNDKFFSLSDVDDFEYFRYDQLDLRINPSIIWTSSIGLSSFELGPYYRYTKVGDNAGKFISEFSQSGLSSDIYGPSNYIGLNAEYRLTSVDNEFYPEIGMKFRMNTSYNLNLNDSNERFAQIKGSLTLYNFLWMPNFIVWATKLEGAFNLGEFKFFQANYIGQNNGLRGFRNERFGGNSSLIFSNDLRLKIGIIKGKTLPMAYGFIGAYDIGRVWNTGEDSSTWHKNFGGGFFFSPLDLVPVSFYYFGNSEDAPLLMIKMGFAF